MTQNGKDHQSLSDSIK